MKRDDPSLLNAPHIERIKPYRFRSRSIAHDDTGRGADEWSAVCKVQGGFNPVTRELWPMKVVSSGLEVHQVLDHIAAAVEAGMVDRNAWSTQLFASAYDLDHFMDELESYDDCYRITDRWWRALAALANFCDEEGFISCAQIADGLRESIVTGAQRRDVLRQEAEYFAKAPLKPIALTDEQIEALSAHNAKLRQEGYAARCNLDVTLNFRFAPPFLFMKGKLLAARQVTEDDLAALATSVQKRATAKSKLPKVKRTKRDAGKN